ncbi:hypothetical protein FRB91_001201, partial [Serendipita sp. 411]
NLHFQDTSLFLNTWASIRLHRAGIQLLPVSPPSVAVCSVPVQFGAPSTSARATPASFHHSDHLRFGLFKDSLLDPSPDLHTAVQANVN